MSEQGQFLSKDQRKGVLYGALISAGIGASTGTNAQEAMLNAAKAGMSAYGGGIKSIYDQKSQELEMEKQQELINAAKMNQGLAQAQGQREQSTWEAAEKNRIDWEKARAARYPEGSVQRHLPPDVIANINMRRDIAGDRNITQEGIAEKKAIAKKKEDTAKATAKAEAEKDKNRTRLMSEFRRNIAIYKDLDKGEDIMSQYALQAMKKQFPDMVYDKVGKRKTLEEMKEPLKELIATQADKLGLKVNITGGRASDHRTGGKKTTGIDTAGASEDLPPPPGDGWEKLENDQGKKIYWNSITGKVAPR